MKKINVLSILLAAVFAQTWISCSDDVEYTPAGAVEGQGAYFAPTNVTNYDDLEASGSITLDVMRTYADAAAEVSLSATYSEGADLFTVPSTVSFAADSETSTVTLNYNNLVRGTTYTVTLSLGKGTPYGQSEITLTLLYPEEVLLEWEVVSTGFHERHFDRKPVLGVQSVGCDHHGYCCGEGSIYQDVPFPQPV